MKMTKTTTVTIEIAPPHSKEMMIEMQSNAPQSAESWLTVERALYGLILVIAAAIRFLHLASQPLNLLEAARRQGVKKFIYASTGGAAYGEPEFLPVDESHPVNPLDCYGASKHTVEHYLFIYRHAYGLDNVTLRYANVYGPRQDPHGEAGVVAIFTGRMLADQPCTIYGTGEQERDFVYVGDVARANLAAATLGSGIYNIGSGKATEINTIFALLKQASGYDQDANYGPAKLGEVYRIVLDTSKAREGLGWQPTVSVVDGLRRTIEHFKAAAKENVPA